MHLLKKMIIFQFNKKKIGLERFSQIELIELVNTGGKGLGFGILGNLLFFFYF